MTDGDITATRGMSKVRWPLVAVVAVVMTVLVGAYLASDKDMRGLPSLLTGEPSVEVPLRTAADVEDTCATPPLLAVTEGPDGHITVEPAQDDDGLTLRETQSVLAEHGYDVALRPTPEGPIGTEPGAILEGGFGGDTVVLFTNDGLVLVRPGDSTITAAVACLPRTAPPTQR